MLQMIPDFSHQKKGMTRQWNVIFKVLIEKTIYLEFHNPQEYPSKTAVK